MFDDIEREDIIEGFVSDFENAARTGDDLEPYLKRYLTISPGLELEIREALNRVVKKYSLENSQGHNVAYGHSETYEREASKLNWYRTREKRDIFWPPLKALIEADLGSAITAIDDSSTNVMNGLKPPSKPQQTRGLVLGYVQSGKTTNFMSVIAKAADSGFRLIIVLTGITDNLRQQTQDRLDEQLIHPQGYRWTKLTDHENDFSGDKNASKLANSHDRFIAVVKKNSHRLQRLNEWIASAGKAAEDCPILVIDDEADQASIDVSQKTKNERSAINRQITRLLERKITAYVAYTATPFANILIDPNDTEDLYPRDFIVSLPEPKGYFGSRQLFGRAPIRGEDSDLAAELGGYDMIRDIPASEVDSILPGKNEDGTRKSVAGGPALADSIRWFVMASAARRVRGQSDRHSSMLVHTSMLTDDHSDLLNIVRMELGRLKKSFADTTLRKHWEKMWAQEADAVPSDTFDLDPVSFAQVEEEVPNVFDDLQIIVDNGSSNARLDYSKGPATVIAIGGNTLSRGLTLEGLVSSYFVRRASAYDTLLQMGRWFGFRKDYEDLPRIWMTEELRSWFFDLATIEAELRDELSVFMDMKYSPLQIQARIRTHPNMDITSKAKMQDARIASVSFAGTKQQTTKFRFNDFEWLSQNLRASRDLIHAIQELGIEEKTGLLGSPLFTKVPHELILKFLREYRFSEKQRLGMNNAFLMQQYIEAEVSEMRLREWNVSIMTQAPREGLGTVSLGLQNPVTTLNRSKVKETSDEQTADINALVSPYDRINDIYFEDAATRKSFRDSVRAEAENRDSNLQHKTAPEPLTRKYHQKHVGPGIGHLALYPIDQTSEPESKSNLPSTSSKSARRGKRTKTRVPLNANEVVMGVGVFFPEPTLRDSEVTYMSAETPTDEVREYYSRIDEEVNTVYTEDENAMENRKH